MERMRGNLWSIVLLILLAACEKDKAVTQIITDQRTFLSVIKAIQDDGEIVLNTIDYNTNGTVKTRISYKDYPSGLISSKADYIYRDNELEYIDEKINFGSGAFSNATQFNRSVFEYDTEGKVIQKNNFQFNNTKFELKSFITFTYNIHRLPVMENRYAENGALTGYSIYEYDKGGNISSASVYSINTMNQTPVLTSKATYTYDSGENPYRKIYATVENIPFSVNLNNVVKTSIADFSKPAVHLQPAQTLVRYIYNKNGLPIAMDENGNRFLLEYR